MNDRYDKCSFINNLMYFTTDSIDVHIDEQVLNVEKMKIKADLSVVQPSIIQRFKDIKNVRMENCQITDGFLETFRNIRYEKGMLIRTFFWSKFNRYVTLIFDNTYLYHDIQFYTYVYRKQEDWR